VDGPLPALADLESERARLEQALVLAERDRQLLGYEIHDGLVQDLTAAAMLLEGMREQAAFSSPEAKENFEGGVRLLREAIAEARRLIRGLATVELDERGLASALERLAGKFRTELGVPLDFRGEAGIVDLPASAQHLLLRIAQEALYNVWKHAGATHVELKLAQRGSHLELAVEDDGAGFDPKRSAPGHFGLEGMRSRARVLGAQLTIDSAPGTGTRIIVRL
jgi:signal transduction histidine kinase